MNYTEFSGKTVADAIKKGLKELGLTEETASIRVLEEGKVKLFGSVKARVEIAPLAEETAVAEETPVVESATKTDGERAVAFLEGLLEILNVNAVVELKGEGEKIEIELTSADEASIIGKRGATLDAIQTLAGAVANTGREDYKRVVVDCENYREGREKTLVRLAENLAAKAIRMERKIKLEPMNPYERRIIHAALSEYEGVKTESAGKEPQRYVVIVPENLSDPDAPAIPARNERGDRRERDRGYSRDRRGDRGGRDRNGRGGRKPMGGGRSSGNGGGTSVKKSSDFFGTFLGNSKDQQ